jgi:ubiquinone/menaquinone biosynthesis C-methylase UbiE
MNNQTSAFRDGEADLWYARNNTVLNRAGISKEELTFERKELCSTLEPFKQNIKRVLEIGCSSGQKLQALSAVLEASGDGIEPSKLAVDEGNRRLKNSNVHLKCGTADQITYGSNSFDLVYFGFCLYLFDRSNLFASLSEADRVLKKGGFLAITDFDPGVKSKRPYIHKAGIFSYKQDYSKFYTESGLYYLVGKKSFSHRQAFFDFDSDERVSLTVLYKEVDPYPLNVAEVKR